MPISNYIISFLGQRFIIGDNLFILRECLCACFAVASAKIPTQRERKATALVSAFSELADWQAKISGADLDVTELRKEIQKDFLEYYKDYAESLGEGHEGLENPNIGYLMAIVASRSTEHIVGYMGERISDPMAASLDAICMNAFVGELPKLL